MKWLVQLDLNNHTVIRTGHAFSQWIQDGIYGLKGLDFDAPIGCGQCVSSPLTRVAVFDMLLSALEDDDTAAGLRMRKPWGGRYAAPDICFVDDLQSFAANLQQLQRKPEIVSGCAAVTGMKIAVNKLCTYHIKGQQDDLRVNRHSWALDI